MASARGNTDAARAGVNIIERHVSGLFADCVKAFSAFADLSELAENLRILSLNAELVAGRAGDAGRAVRALTQYTRELVNRLMQAREDSGEVMKESYRQAAAALRQLHELQLLERADVALGRNNGARRRVEEASDLLMGEIAETVARMVESVNRLAGQARAVESVVSASDSIATNIAIEAVAAGRHESDFRNVAGTMRDYVNQLRTMTEQAGAAVRRAEEQGVRLQTRRGVGRADGAAA